MTDRNKLAGDEFDTRDVLARMLAARSDSGDVLRDPYADEIADLKRRIDAPGPLDFMRHAASYIPVDDRESGARGPSEPWWKWWARTGQDSGGATTLAAALKSGLGTTANWLEGRPQIGADTVAPPGMAAVGMPLTRAAARPSLREWAPPHMGERPYEWPVAATIKLGDDIFDGPSHIDATMKAQARLGDETVYRLLGEGDAAAKDGFRLNTGRVVSREEAGRLVDERNQSNHYTTHWLTGRPKTGWNTMLSEGLETINPKTGKEIDPKTGKELLADSSRASLPGTLVNSLAAANPQRHLDMSDAARAARAEEQGFTNTVYRATSEPKQGYTPNPKGDNVYGLGTYAADDPNWAKGFRSGQGAHVQELLGRSERPFIWDANDMAGTAARIKEIYPDAKPMQYGLPHDQIADWTKALKDAGYDAVRVISGEKPSGSTKTKTFDEWAFLNNNQLRSRDAAFDPALRDSGYLLAADNKTASLPGTLVNALSEQGKPGAAHLPMDHASRMARAQEAGFDTSQPWYHGSPESFSAFDMARVNPRNEWGGFMFSRDLRDAAGYGNPKPYYLRNTKPLMLDENFHPVNASDAKALAEAGIDLRDPAVTYTGKKGAGQRLTERLQELGYDGIEMAHGMGPSDPIPHAVAFDPKNIRRTNAAFDPAKRDSPNVLAAKTDNPVGTLVNALSEQGKPTMSQLAMDEASRMARAKEQGFDPGWYHGTGADKFDEFRRNTYITNMPEEASLYADSAARQDGRRPSVLPLHSRGERYATQADFDAAEVALNKSRKGGYVSSRNVFDELERLGFDGFTEADASGRAMRIVFDPKNIRSKFAAFDPAHAGSGKIMAGLAAPAIMAPALVNALSGESSND